MTLPAHRQASASPSNVASHGTCVALAGGLRPPAIRLHAMMQGITTYRHMAVREKERGRLISLCRGTTTKTARELLAQGIVRQLMPRGRFLPFDFGSSFGTMSHGIHGFLSPLEDHNVAVPKVHFAHSSQHQRCQAPMLQHSLKQAVSGPNDLRELFILIPHLLSISEPIACKDANLFEAFSCPWTPLSTFYKLLEIERIERTAFG